MVPWESGVLKTQSKIILGPSKHCPSVVGAYVYRLICAPSHWLNPPTVEKVRFRGWLIHLQLGVKNQIAYPVLNKRNTLASTIGTLIVFVTVLQSFQFVTRACLKMSSVFLCCRLLSSTKLTSSVPEQAWTKKNKKNKAAILDSKEETMHRVTSLFDQMTVVMIISYILYTVLIGFSPVSAFVWAPMGAGKPIRQKDSIILYPRIQAPVHALCQDKQIWPPIERQTGSLVRIVRIKRSMLMCHPLSKS